MRLGFLLKRNLKFLVFTAGVAFFAVGGYIVYQKYVSAEQDWGSLSAQPEEVRGKTVVLRTLKESYFIDFHNMFSADVRQNIQFPAFIDLDYTIRYLKYEMDRNKAGKQLQYCIFDAKEDRLIGSIDIREKDETDPGQFGCWINENYRGGGRIQEAIKLIVNVYFRMHPGVSSFTAWVRPWNKRSYRALIKAGFVDTSKLATYMNEPAHVLEYHKKK